MNDQATQARAPKLAGKAAAAKPPGATSAEAAEAATHAPAEVARVVGHISPATAVLAERVRNAWHVVAAPGTLPADLDLDPAPFDLIARDLNRFDDVRVVAAEETWMADYIVVDHAPGYALCRLVQAINLPRRRVDESDRVPFTHYVEMVPVTDPAGGWRVMRRADGVCISGGQFIHSKNDAIEFLLRHASVVDALKR